MENFSAITILDWTQASQFAQHLLLHNTWHNQCSFNLETDRNGNLTDKGWNELLRIFNDKEYTIKYFTENIVPDISKREIHLDTKEKEALSNLLRKCYKIYEERNMNFAYSLLNNYIKQYHSFPIEDDCYVDDELEECNRQFDSMMNDNEAWGNID